MQHSLRCQHQAEFANRRQDEAVCFAAQQGLTRKTKAASLKWGAQRKAIEQNHPARWPWSACTGEGFGSISNTNEVSSVAYCVSAERNRCHERDAGKG